MRGGPNAREPVAEKKHDRGWGDEERCAPHLRSSRPSGSSSSRTCRPARRALDQFEIARYVGRAPAVMKSRETIKRQTIEHRRLQCRKPTT
jgi:hypothetical protein